MDISKQLENEIFSGTLQDTAEFFKNHRKDIDMQKVLVLACRFGGMEYVKALVENGAVLRNKRNHYSLALLKRNEALCCWSFLGLSRKEYYQVLSQTCRFNDKKSGRYYEHKLYKPLPPEQRIEIIKYLSENGERICFDPSELLYYSILFNDKEIISALKEMGVTLYSERVSFDLSELLYYSIMHNNKEMIASLKEKGVTFSEKRIAALTESTRGLKWKEFCSLLMRLEDEECFDVLQNVVKEVGEKKMNFSDCVLGYEYYPEFNRSYYSDPEKFGYILEHFNQKQMYKMGVMVCAINAGCAESLEICTKHGWLTKLSNCDELIEYAIEEKKTECVAFLLDFKNRNFDLAAERKKADKRMRWEL